MRAAGIRWRAVLATAAILSGLAFAVPAQDGYAAPANPSDTEIASAQAQAHANSAELGRLQGLIASAEGELVRLGQQVDAAIAAYDEASWRVQDAVSRADVARVALTGAQAAEDLARAQLRDIAKAAYIHGSASTMSALITSEAPAELAQAIDARRFVAAAQNARTTNLSRIVVESSNADASLRAAVAEAEQLQTAADKAKDIALGLLEVGRVRRIQLEATKADLNAQAAVAAGKLSGLLDQRAAFDAWQVEQARIQEVERQRQAAIDAAARNSARDNSGGNDQVPSGGSSIAVSAGGWVLPLTNYYISSGFGNRGGTFHYGLDFAAPLGTPIYSIGDGTVIAAGPASGFGNWVVIDHGNGWVSIYGHMRVYTVSRGERVSAGQLIAYVGTEGQSTGPHLHLEIRSGGMSGRAYDPQVWLTARGIAP
jgi:murein DD-endopeptidase MepM/ murein hydrolase activator NlpD